LILFLLSADFLASDYSLGVEVQTALDRLKRGEAKIVPILLRSCLWEESLFSELNVIPIDGRPKPICSWTSVDDALLDVARQISRLVAKDPPQAPNPSQKFPQAHQFDSSLDLVRNQICCYARIYEKTRQRMAPSSQRTMRMEQIFDNMRNLATASYPLLQELASSPLPGDRLSALSILQVFASEQLLPFLTGLLQRDKPFVCYHALKALRFAVNSLDPTSYGALSKALANAKTALQQSEAVDDPGCKTQLSAAERELQANVIATTAPTSTFD
jgi:hypothetical protein